MRDHLPKCGYFVGKTVPAGCRGTIDYATRLAQSLHDKHFSDVTQWEPLKGDLSGLITQIDNMTVGMSDEIERLRAEIAKRDALAEDAHEYVLAQINADLKVENERLRADCRLRQFQGKRIGEDKERERCAKMLDRRVEELGVNPSDSSRIASAELTRAAAAIRAKDAD